MAHQINVKSVTDVLTNLSKSPNFKNAKMTHIDSNMLLNIDSPNKFTLDDIPQEEEKTLYQLGTDSKKRAHSTLAF